jgi:predicted  nucleic acid-binding Zn-ribbon protein
LSAQEASGSSSEQKFPTYESELSELNAIWARLSILSAAQNQDLLLSKESLRKLTAELEHLKSELTVLRQKLQHSEGQLTELSEELKKVWSSLEDLERSFTEYKRAAEAKIKAESRKVWMAAGLGALGGATVAFILAAVAR